VFVVDTNVLIYAADQDAPAHKRTSECRYRLRISTLERGSRREKEKSDGGFLMRCGLSVAAIALLAACSSSTGATTFAGSYSLVAVNGQTPPFTVYLVETTTPGPGTERQSQIAGGTGQLLQDHSYSLALAFLNYSAETGLTSKDTVFYVGTWSGNADAITFTDGPSGVTLGSGSSNAGDLTIDVPSPAFAFPQFSFTTTNLIFRFVRQ
jgi:hypothetical protein